MRTFYIKWMNMIFELQEETLETHREYKQELFNIYKKRIGRH